MRFFMRRSAAGSEPDEYAESLITVVLSGETGAPEPGSTHGFEFNGPECFLYISGVLLCEAGGLCGSQRCCNLDGARF